MRLRRVTAHVKAQNWTSVAIDFAIVVLGVFVAIQVSNWNEGRLERQREATLLESLRGDFEALDSALSHGVAFHEKGVAGITTIYQALRAKSLAGLDLAGFKDGLRFGYLNTSTNTSSSTLTELLSSGQLSIIRDLKLRSALAEYESYRISAAQSKAEIRDMATQYMTHFTAHFSYHPERNYPRPNQENPRVFLFSDIDEFSFESMLADDSFAEAVQELREMQRIWLQWEQALLWRIHHIQRLLGGSMEMDRTDRG